MQKLVLCRSFVRTLFYFTYTINKPGTCFLCMEMALGQSYYECLVCYEWGTGTILRLVSLICFPSKTKWQMRHSICLYISYLYLCFFSFYVFLFINPHLSFFSQESVWLDGDSRWNSSIQVLAPFCADKLSSDFKIRFPLRGG